MGGVVIVVLVVVSAVTELIVKVAEIGKIILSK